MTVKAICTRRSLGQGAAPESTEVKTIRTVYTFTGLGSMGDRLCFDWVRILKELSVEAHGRTDLKGLRMRST